MAVTTTVQQIITAGLNRSSKNSPGIIANNTSELVEVVRRALTGLYTYAARVNPTYFADTMDVALTGGAWPRPETAESIFRIEQADTTEVIVVPFDDRKADEGMPAVYRFGQKFRSAGNALDPVAGSLTFFFSKRPAIVTALADVIDSSWNESYNDLLISEVAIYLALKDGRDDEIADLRTDRDKWAMLFTAFLEHETIGERRRFGLVNRYSTASIVPLNSILAGGAAPGAQ